MTTHRPLVMSAGVVRQLPLGDQVVGGPFIGEVRQFAGSADALPDGWLVGDGAEVSRVDRAALFAVIGTRFGVGDGVSTFNLPNLVGKFVAGAAPATGPGGTGGSNVISLAVEHMPEHDHTVDVTLSASNAAAFAPAPFGGASLAILQAGLNAKIYGQGAPDTALHAGSATADVGTAGSGQPFDNRPAFVELLYIIYAGT